MKKRYGIVLPENVYRDMRLKAVAANMSVGEWITTQMNGRGVDGNFDAVVTSDTTGALHVEGFSLVKKDDVDQIRNFYHEEAAVEEPIKKAIEPDKTREVKGQLRKGLGPLPGEEKSDNFGRPKPAPKPGTKK